MTELVFNNVISVTTEDGGTFRIIELDNETSTIAIRIQSYSPIGDHAELDALIESGMFVIIRDRRLL